MPQAGGKRKAAYYKAAAAEAKRQQYHRPSTTVEVGRLLQAGQVGYLVSFANKQERVATVEAYRLLNDTLEEHRSGSRANQDTLIESANQETPTEPDNQPAPTEPTNQETTVESTDQQAPTEPTNQETIAKSTNKQAPSESADQDTAVKEAGNDDDDDILTQLERENQTESGERPRYAFKLVKTGVSNRMFIAHNPGHDLSPPTVLAHRLFRRLSDRVAASRMILRLMPVEAVCRANLDSISSKFAQIWTTFTADQEASSSSTGYSRLATTEPRTFLVDVKIANYNLVSRDDIIEAVAAVVRDKTPDWRVSPKRPSVLVFVTVIRSQACLSLLENYQKYRRYNVTELLAWGPEPEPTEGSDSGTTDKSTGGEKAGEETETAAEQEDKATVESGDEKQSDKVSAT